MTPTGITDPGYNRIRRLRTRRAGRPSGRRACRKAERAGGKRINTTCGDDSVEAAVPAAIL